MYYIGFKLYELAIIKTQKRCPLKFIITYNKNHNMQ